MSTVDLTPEKNNGPQRLTKSQRRLERLLKMAGKHALTSKKNYSNYRDVLDFMQDDTGMMETLLGTLECSWTDWRKFSQEEKERVGWAIGKWTVMAAKIGSFWPFDFGKAVLL